MKELIKTKVTVRLRKAEFRKEWFIYLESYPVMVQGKNDPQRIREYLNRSVTTVDFDKKRPARTTQNSVSFKPKRDDNGIIVCKSENDRETMFYADSLRKLRQREYDNIELFNEFDIIQHEEKERSQENFVRYFDLLVNKRHKNNSESIQVNWYRSIEFLKDFGGEKIMFSQISQGHNQYFPLLIYSSPDTICFSSEYRVIKEIVWNTESKEKINLVNDQFIFSELKIAFGILPNFYGFDIGYHVALESLSIANNLIEDDNYYYSKWSEENEVKIFYSPEIRVDMQIDFEKHKKTIAFFNAEHYFISVDGLNETQIILQSGISPEFLINQKDFVDNHQHLVPTVQDYIRNKNIFISNVISKITSLNSSDVANEDLLLVKQVLNEEAEKDERAILVEELQLIELEIGKFSYSWFNVYLQILETYSDSSNNQPYKSIKFSKISAIKDDDFFLLSGGSSYISNDISEIHSCKITIYYSDGLKQPLSISNLSKQNQDLVIQTDRKLNKNSLNKVFQIELEYHPVIDLLSRLRVAFEKISSWDDIQQSFPPLYYYYGPPGTGKTHTVCEKIISEVSVNNDTKFLVLTPTNKAADVIGERLIDNEFHSFIRLSGQTSLKIDEDYYTNDLHKENLDNNNVLISTIHRFPYYILNMGESSMLLNNLRDYWDYIVIDESSMVSLPYLVFAIMKIQELNPFAKIIIAGDPKQIPPVPDVSDKLLEELNVGSDNIYSMLGLISYDEEKQKTEIREIDIVENLPMQRRSVPEIGNLFSKFSYDGKVANHRMSADKRPINADFQSIFKNAISFINIPVNQNHEIYGVHKLYYSSFHLYSCILITHIIEFLNNVNSNDEIWTIGIISPYKYQATLINKLVANLDISENFIITADTVHGFQGDQCNIVFFIVNPNNYKYTGHPNSLLSKEYIYNVAISRAQDYLIIVSPFNDIPDNKHLCKILEIYDENMGESAKLIDSHEIERILFGDENYIEYNSFVTSHDNVNVFKPSSYKYYVKKGSTAIDIQIN